MKTSGMQKGIMLSLLSLLVLVALPATGMAQGRGHGRGGRWGDFDGDGNRDKKCEKFVNCHDARDGRWDGRGPQRDDDRFRNRDIWRHRDFRGGRFWNNGDRFDRQRLRERRYFAMRDRDLRMRNRYWNRRYVHRY